MKYGELDRARKILGLGEEASLEEIKKAYRELVNKYHPDKCKDKRKKECEEKIKEINWAYGIIKEYLYSYRYSFRKEDFEKMHIDLDEEMRRHMERFYNGWWEELKF